MDTGRVTNWAAALRPVCRSGGVNMYDGSDDPGAGRGDEEIFPDQMAQQMGALWLRDPKADEPAFASF